MGCYWKYCVFIFPLVSSVGFSRMLGYLFRCLFRFEGCSGLLSGVMKGLGRRDGYGRCELGSKGDSWSSMNWVGFVWGC